jgi:hypothetical protein
MAHTPIIQISGLYGEVCKCNLCQAAIHNIDYIGVTFNTLVRAQVGGRL